MKLAKNIETEVISILDGLGIKYEIINIDRQYADTADFCREYDYPLENCGNTIIVSSRKEPKQFSVCVVKGSTRLDVNRTVRKLMGVRRLSFASTEDTMKLTGMEIGGVTPLALPDSVQIYVDSLVMNLEFVILGSGSRCSKISISPIVFRKLENMKVIEGLSVTPPE